MGNIVLIRSAVPFNVDGKDDIVSELRKYAMAKYIAIRDSSDTPESDFNFYIKNCLVLNMLSVWHAVHVMGHEIPHNIRIQLDDYNKRSREGYINASYINPNLSAEDFSISIYKDGSEKKVCITADGFNYRYLEKTLK